MTFSINLSNLNGSNGFSLNGVTPHARLGGSVSNAGDVNGDGFGDVIIGASETDSNGVRSGSSYVVFGKASGFSAVMDLSSLNGSNGFRLDGHPFNFSGISVSTAGDVNGDGFDDVIVGVPYADRNGSYSNSGSSYVVFGKASGFSATMNLPTIHHHSNGFRLNGETVGGRSGSSVSNAGDVNGDGFDDVIVGASGPSYVVFGKAFKASGFTAEMDLSTLNGSNGFRLDGAVSSVSNAGDVNGDGFDDVIVGASRADPNGSFSGSSYVVFGKASGFSAVMNLSSLNGSNGFRLDGVAAYDQSGRSVSSAGDVNGDGFDDVIVGAVGADPNGSFSGSSYVVFGKASGFSAAMDLSTLNGNNGFRLDGETAFDGSGQSVSTAGDVNGDGFDDLIVGALVSSSNGLSSGSSYVVYGKASGFNASMDLSTLDGNNGFRLEGVAKEKLSGASVSTAGDVNGDGFDDLIVGSPGTRNDNQSGSSYIIFGRSDFGSVLPEILGTAGDDTLTGTVFADHFKAGDGNDKLIGRGGADSFDGGTGDDKIQVADLSFASVGGGAGIDVLHLAGTGLNLNLADSGDRISGIEIISLYSQGDRNTLTLTAADLSNLSTNTLKVNGNAGGHIVVEDSGWIDGGSRGSGYYHEYTQGDAVLLVGQNLTVDFVAA